MILCRKKTKVALQKISKTPLILNDFFEQKITDNDKSKA